jgi:TPR repeat protein
VDWYCAAAADDVPLAMNKCGYEFSIGEPGVPPDRVEALMWLTLAAERSGPGEAQDRGTVNLLQALAQASSGEVTEAGRRAEAMRTRLNKR